MIVLDTNVVSELMRAAPDPAVVAWVDDHSPGLFALTAISAAELWFGVARLPAGRRRDALASAVDAVVDNEIGRRVLAFDLEAAEVHAAIAARSERSGRPRSMADGQIAAICLARGLPLATRNTGDFEGTGVELLDPWGS